MVMGASGAAVMTMVVAWQVGAAVVAAALAVVSTVVAARVVAATMATAVVHSNATGGAAGASPPRRGRALLKMAQLRRATRAESC